MNHTISLLLAMAVFVSVGLAADAPPAGPATPPPHNDGNTPLHLAVLRNDADTVEALLKRGADAGAVNAAGVTPLHYATASQRMVTALLANGAPVNAVSKQQLVVFGPGGAIAHAHIPLALAVLHPDSYAVVRRLIQAGAEVKYRIGREISLILNLTITGGDRRTVELLLDHGAEVNPAEGSLPSLFKQVEQAAAHIKDAQVVAIDSDAGHMLCFGADPDAYWIIGEVVRGLVAGLPNTATVK